MKTDRQSVSADSGRIHLVLNISVLAILFLSSCAPQNPYPFSEPGPYGYGTKGAFNQMYSFIDTSRADREIKTLVWYPAKMQTNATPTTYNIDAEPDLSGVPYPLILSSAKVASYFGAHLASHGFVVVGVKGLEGMIDAEHVGVMGYSFDGYNSLAMSGARVDPEYYLSSCTDAANSQPPLPEWAIKLYCAPATDWVEFSTNAGTSLTTSNDGLWQPMTDERIRAVIPMAPEGAMLFGERGLAEVNRPILILVGTVDTGCDYNREAVTIFNQIGTPEKTLISFIGEDHNMLFNDEPFLRMKHFVTAFLGYHLQGREDYADYFSEKFVSRRDGLAWGVYEGE